MAMTEEDLNQAERHKSYDLTQRLAFFVIGIEMIFCGYLLLKAKDFSQYKGYLKFLFLVSGISASLGIFWRFIYNVVYYSRTHKNEYKADLLQGILHSLFVISSLIFLIGILCLGYKYIDSFKVK